MAWLPLDFPSQCCFPFFINGWSRRMKVHELLAPALPVSTELRDRVINGRSSSTREFVLSVDDEESGLLILECWASRQLGFVYELRVLKAWRGHGVGTAALKHAETMARREGYSRLSLKPYSLDSEGLANDALVAWYRRHGFEFGITDASLMCKHLIPVLPVEAD